MKKTMLFSLFVAFATFSSWMPAKKAAHVSMTSFDQYLLLPITPSVTYGSFSYTASATSVPTATFYWTTTSETNVVKFQVHRLHMPTSTIVIHEIAAKTTGFPRSYSFVDYTVFAGTTYYYSVCAVSSDNTRAACSPTTEVPVPGITR